MKSVHLLKSVQLVYICLVVARVASEGQEYCEGETFEASCGPDEVIMMGESLYGRMSLGRCLTMDYGYVGCSSDVLDLTDLMCSGRRQCSIPVPNSMLDAVQPCPADLTPYLWASYSCIKVVEPDNGFCDQPMTLTAPEGNLASVVTMETNCGSIDYPYRIRVEEGQTIKITLMDFSRFLNNNENICTVYALIRERHPGQSVTICANNNRQQHVYTSSSNTVEIRMVNRSSSETANYYILSYEAVRT